MTTIFAWIELISGILWIPYCLLFVFLFIEQYTHRRYPQYLIIFFLLVGNIFRCVWFLGSTNYSSLLGYLTINRLAILCQFTALSLLILMWSRVLKVSSNLKDEANPHPVLPTTLTPSDAIPSVDKSGGEDLQSTLARISKTKSQTKISDFHSVYFWVVVSMNVVVWCFILITIVMSVRGYPALYNVNILLISFLCLLEASIILFVGISTGLRISRELSPVYMSWRNSPEMEKSTLKKMQLTVTNLCRFCTPGVDANYQLHCQAKAVRKLITVSGVIGIFFLLRSFFFLYRFLTDNTRFYNSVIETYDYPWFFYQFPELFPNLVIAAGVAPPNGILRRIYRAVTTCNCAVKIFSRDTESTEKRSSSSKSQIPMSTNLSLSGNWRYREDSMASINGDSMHFDDFSDVSLDHRESRESDNRQSRSTAGSVSNPLYSSNTPRVSDRDSGQTSVRTSSVFEVDNAGASAIRSHSNSLARTSSIVMQSPSIG